MRMLAFLFLLSALPWVCRAQGNPQSDKITKRYFPDPELDIRTPAFAKADGFTNYEELIAFLEKAVKEHPEKIKLSYLGESQKGKRIPMVVLSQGNPGGVRVWMQGGLHGDEPAGTEAMLYLIDRLLNDASLASSWAGIELAVVPMANIDGYLAGKRLSSNGIDLNRDQVALHAQESVALKRAFSRFNPQVALDFHEYRAFRKDYNRLGTDGIAMSYDAMFLYSGNLNVPEKLRRLTRDTFVAAACRRLDEHGLTHHDYVTPQRYGGRVEYNLGSVHARSSASSWALAGAVSTLLEIRGVGLGRTSFKRRVHASYLIALSYLKKASEQAKMVTETTMLPASDCSPIVVLSEREVRKDTLQVIDLARHERVPMAFQIHDSWRSKAVLSRPRPAAYYLPPSERQAARNLQILGVQVDSLDQDREVEVEALRPTGLAFDTTGEEDQEAASEARPASAAASVRKTFAKGSYVVRLPQPRAGLAVEVLEPENVNGFLANRVIRIRPGEEYPVYRSTAPCAPNASTPARE